MFIILFNLTPFTSLYCLKFEYYRWSITLIHQFTWINKNKVKFNHSNVLSHHWRYTYIWFFSQSLTGYATFTSVDGWAGSLPAFNNGSVEILAWTMDNFHRSFQKVFTVMKNCSTQSSLHFQEGLDLNNIFISTKVYFCLFQSTFDRNNLYLRLKSIMYITNNKSSKYYLT